MKKLLLILLLLPAFGHAEGQEALSLFLDIIVFVKVFTVWAIVVFPTLFIINKYRTQKWTFNFKALIVIGTGLMALFIFSMVKFDSEPYDGPIDSIIYKDFNEEHRKQDSLYIAEGYPDSTIMETSSIDTSKNGIYIWLNHKELFVRKNIKNFDTQRQEDSVTMSIVRRWTNSKNSNNGKPDKY